MAKTEIIGWEGKQPEAQPKDYHPELNYRLRSPKLRGKNVTHKDFLQHLRTKRFAREVHSDGFLAITHEARECPDDGGCATWREGYICPRCGNEVI